MADFKTILVTLALLGGAAFIYFQKDSKRKEDVVLDATRDVTKLTKKCGIIITDLKLEAQDARNDLKLYKERIKASNTGWFKKCKELRLSGKIVELKSKIRELKRRKSYREKFCIFNVWCWVKRI